MGKLVRVTYPPDSLDCNVIPGPQDGRILKIDHVIEDGGRLPHKLLVHFEYSPDEDGPPDVPQEDCWINLETGKDETYNAPISGIEMI